MPSIKDLKKRIVSTKSTQQTTRAMKLVSAAKLRRAQEAILAHRPYSRQIAGMIRRAVGLSSAPFVSPLVKREEGEKPISERTVLLLLVSSDRGLCGAFNGNIIKRAQRWKAAEGSPYKEVKWAFLGRKASDFFKNRGIKAAISQEVGRKATFDNAKKMTQFLIDEYLAGRVDEVKIIYNEFKNAITQEVIVEDFLPLQKTAVAELNLGEKKTTRTETVKSRIFILLNPITTN